MSSLIISKEAADVYRSCDVIDLHIDSFIWNRVFGYDLKKRHGHGLFSGRFYSQVDIPRIREAAITGGIWSITTNPLRSRVGRTSTFEKNLNRLVHIFENVSNDVAFVKTASEYDQARKKGLHGAWIGIQGGNAIDGDEAVFERVANKIIRVTLVHLWNSSIGTTSSPLNLRKDLGLTQFGKDFVKRLNANKIFVDLAHISRKGFFDAVEVHDHTQPLIVTHTGVSGVHAHWRNLDDEQIRAIAKTGGVIGVIYQSSFLGDPVFGGKIESIVRHLEHIINIAGEDCASLGSDWDGMITPPLGMPSCLELPLVVQCMLDRNWNVDRIRKTLGGNYLRALRMLRP